jgi:uncharacterized membrane protein YfcA
MNLLYNGVVGYQRLNNLWGSILLSIFGIVFIIGGIYMFFNPSQPIPNNTPSTTNTPFTTNTPSTTDSPHAWSMLSGIGVIFMIISGVMYFLATDNSEATRNILAAQGTYNIFNSMFQNNRNGGNFEIGE